MKKQLLPAFAFILPLLAQAAGMGVSVPYNISETERISYSNVNLEKTTYDYKPSTGLGFVFDTNIGKDKDFSYRLDFEYSLAELDHSSRLLSSNVLKHKYSIVNTFGLSVYHSRYVRFWAGPRVIVQYEHLSSSSNISSQNTYGLGMGIATGVNVHLGPKISIGADIDYHGVWMFGGEHYHLYDGTTMSDETYYTVVGGSNKGSTARLYLLLRFGETYEQVPDKGHDESVIDYSL